MVAINRVFLISQISSVSRLFDMAIDSVTSYVMVIE